MSNTYGIISLIFALVGLFIGWIPFIGLFGLIFPIIAIIFGAIGIKKDDSHGMAIAGLVIGCISLLCIILVVTVFAILFAALFAGLGGLGGLT
jgi:hypothetical protein